MGGVTDKIRDPPELQPVVRNCVARGWLPRRCDRVRLVPGSALHSPKLLPSGLVMYRFVPSVAMPTCPFSPETKAAFTVPPEVVYSPTMPEMKFVTKMFDPRM